MSGLEMKLLVLFFNSFLFVSCKNDFLCDKCKGVIIDTDAGGDDAMAISLMLKAESLGYRTPFGDVISFTTVTGNTGAYNVTRNVKEILKILNRTELPVYRGMEDGLSVYTPPSNWFGYDGFGDFLPSASFKPILPTDVNPGHYLASMVHQYPGRITILAIGPLTNLAMAIHFNAQFFDEVKHIVILGGDYKGRGNTSPGVEANMFSDPDAANYFFSNIPPSAANKVSLVPIETIFEYATYPMTYRRNKLGKFNNTLVHFLNKAEAISLIKEKDVWPCYDPAAAIVLLNDDIIKNTIPANVNVVTQGPRGVMLASFQKPYNVNLLTKLSSDGIKEMLEHLLA